MSRVRYFHGGPAGLRGEILPPERTGAATTADYGAAHVCRRDRVYLLTDPELAIVYAAGAISQRPGWVYEVEPVGDVEPDADWLGPEGASVCARRARIRRVHRRLTDAERRAVRRQLAELIA